MDTGPIIPRTWRLLGQVVNILLEGTPPHVDLAEVARAMRTVPGVRQVHDLHVWTLTSGKHAMSGHVVVGDLSASDRILRELHATLHDRYGIEHTTVQVEPERLVKIQGLGVCHAVAAVAFLALAAGSPGLTPAVAEPRVIELNVRERVLPQDLRLIRIRQHDDVTLKWTTNHTLTVQIHGYDLQREVKPGETVTMTFRARLSGRFPVTVDVPGQRHEGRLATLEVHPH